MTAAAFEVLDVDVDRAIAELGRRFPKVPVWAGEYTGNWFALVGDRVRGEQLVEADTVAGLARKLNAIQGRMAPRVPRPPRPAAAPAVGQGGRWESAAARSEATYTPTASLAAAPSSPSQSERRGRHEAAGRDGLMRRLRGGLLAVGGW